MKDIMELCDLVIENCLIVELKASKTFSPGHKAQLIGYLRASSIEHGLLINFGSYKFQIQKYALSSPSTSITQKLSSLLFPLFAFSAFFRG